MEKVVNILPLVNNIGVIREENFHFCLATAADGSIDSIIPMEYMLSTFAVMLLNPVAIDELRDLTFTPSIDTFV